nr:retrovirus-related Pol polyprotein from transposon TNT 1-94 [Tanacetum cinerariifolium]
MNAHVKSKSIKKSSKRQVWKPGESFRIYNRRTSLGLVLHEMNPTIISSRLVPNTPHSTPFVPPSRTDWDILFHPLFDEFLTPPPSVDHLAPKVIALITKVVAPEPAASTGSPSVTIVDHDAPSPSYSQTTPETQSPIIPNNVEEDNHYLDVAHMNHDAFFDKVMVITLKWIYKVKLDKLGGILKNKARLVACGYCQEVFCSDCKVRGYKDFSRVFRSHEHDSLPNGREDCISEWLKQAPRAWYNMLSSFLISQDFSKVSVDPTMFLRRDGKELLLYQARPTEKHLHVVKRIFRYLRGTVNQGLWYPKDSLIALTAFSYADLDSLIALTAFSYADLVVCNS